MTASPGSARLASYPYRVTEAGAVERRVRGDWHPLTRAELLALPVDGEVWAWLRERGLRRPSPSGPSTPEDARGTVRVTLRLPPEAAARLDALATESGVSRAEVVARLVSRK